MFLLYVSVNPACSTNDQESTEIDEDIAVKQEVVTKCPYTGKEMRDPVRNIHCNHNYDRDGITEAMKLRKGKTRYVTVLAKYDRQINRTIYS